MVVPTPAVRVSADTAAIVAALRPPLREHSGRQEPGVSPSAFFRQRVKSAFHGASGEMRGQVLQWEQLPALPFRGCGNGERRPPSWRCASSVQEKEVATAGASRSVPRQAVRLALPSKGRMAEDTLELLKACQLTVRKPNPRQYIADIDEMVGVEVWFQRAADVVRKLRGGDVDLGIVGFDMVQEFGQGDDDLVIVHDSLGFGGCHLAVAVPTYGIFESISTLGELMGMPQWTADHPLRIVTGYTHLGSKFLEDNGFRHVQLSTADGALEAAPAMGTADAILDLVSSGTTLRENNLKELKGGRVLQSQGVLVASRRALKERKGALEATREMLERLEAHLRAKNRFSVISNMRGSSEEEVVRRVFEKTQFPGLQGPTVSPVFSRGSDGQVKLNYYSVTVVVPKARLYDAVQELRAAGGSGVLVTPLTYIFDEEPPRWRQLLDSLHMSKESELEATKVHIGSQLGPLAV